MSDRKRVPVNNVDPVLVDVKKPGFNYENRVKFANLNLTRSPRKISIKTGSRRKILNWGIALAFFAVITISVFALLNLRQVKAVALAGGERVIGNFIASVEALKNLEPASATPFLRENAEEISRLRRTTLFGFLGGIIPVFEETGKFLGELAELNLDFIKLSEALADLKLNGFDYFQNDGETLLARLEELKGLIAALTGRVELIKNSTASLKKVSPVFTSADELLSGEYLKHSSDLKSLDNFLGGLIEIFGTEEEKRVLLFFHNQAEIRPAGGFIGSYGVLTVKHGQMVDLEVQDIYWPDHPLNFDSKVIPPEPLQAVVTDWATRDGNWFFDFPTSARTVMEFLESSKIYKASGIKFEGAIAVNIKVIETILGVVGPVAVDDYDLVITSENFHEEIQREVETGRDKKPGQNPKRVLSVITPVIIDKLNGLDETARRELFDGLGNHFDKKDIMVFSRAPSLASFLDSIGVDGSVYSPPSSFWGSYLAVVNANIAAGKSDAFVEESVEARLDIDSEGGVFTDLSVVRTHRGDKEKDPWWRANNQNFIQVSTNPGSTIVSLKGNDIKRYAKPSYGKEYATNPDLSKIESTKVLLTDYNAWSMSAFGKTVFATWWNVPAGESETLNLRYQTPSGSHSAPAPGKKFRFVFERQSGVKNSLKVNIGAPLGYRWAESQSPVFIYEDADPDARVILDLTLTK
ncbi:MAG: DUF4012 domain-containing protein [Candidatus Brennerbacteria bacterium]|nr:DUF4012 domain-containing protein [Candidatus Brennerbacteria bacterium]